jgi:murein DD-endopeptidase MepM/ murein hydrolase activator NlpD
MLFCWAFKEVGKNVETQYDLVGAYSNDNQTLIGGSDIDTFAAFQYTHQGWHTISDNYTPVAGDFIFFYSPERISNDDGTVTVVDKPTVDESVTDNEFGYKFDDFTSSLRVSDVGFVESCSDGGTIQFIHYNAETNKVERKTIEKTDARIVAYSTPNYMAAIGTSAFSWSGLNPEKGNFLLPFIADDILVSAGYPRYPKGGEHHGVDFACPKGTRVIASASGTVTFAGKGTGDNWSFGNYVVIEHILPGGSKAWSYYAHLDQCLVTEGQYVVAGDVIGRSGNTGNVQGTNGGYHVHFAIKTTPGRGNWDDPVPWFARASEIKVGNYLSQEAPQYSVNENASVGDQTGNASGTNNPQSQ